MLLHLIYPLSVDYTFFNVFKYITFRTFGAAITSVLLCMFLGPAFIRFLQKKQIGQAIRSDGPRSHLAKEGTPTMGGALILICVILSTLLWGDLNSKYIWIALGSILFFGIIGYIDDHLKISRKQAKGLSALQKIVLQVIGAFAISVAIFVLRDTTPTLKFPFFKDLSIYLGTGYIFFSMLVIVGTSNAVNLTDGLDGLAVGPTITTAGTFVILAYCAGHVEFADHLNIPYVKGAGELSIFLGAVAAACLGFLWFNTYPAQVFMGDVGSLALGAALAVASVITKNELLLALCGGIFVIETLSVITQVISFKMTGKRVFKMAPIHHHFELKGWAEPKVIVRFWIISVLLALMTLATLKLR